MKFYPCALAACVLLSVAACIATASASSVTVPVPSSFAISEFGKAVDNGSNVYSPGPGPVTFFGGGETLYVRVPAAARNGTRLVSLQDRESGIVFRNNTLLLPVYSAGEKAGGLVVTTDILTAGPDGYVGQVTGLELDLAERVETRNGTDYTAGAVILLNDLPAEAVYRMSFADNGTVAKAIASDLEARDSALVAMSPALEAGGADGASEDAVGYVIVTIQAGRGWPGLDNANNTTLYQYNDSGLSRLRPRVVSTENGTAYQAVAPGPGQFVLVAAGPHSDIATDASFADVGGLAILGGIIIVLLIALAAMVRRVAKR